MENEQKLKMEVEIESIKATPREGVTLDELAAEMEDLGNEILETNYEENYLIIKH